MPGTAVPERLAHRMAPFAASFTRPTWRNLLVLIAGAILAPGRRTVTAALSVMGLRHRPTFTNFHRVLNRNRWSGLGPARRLLRLLVAGFAPDGPVVIGLDETLARRWGRRIKARGIDRDPVRSSRGHFVKAMRRRRHLILRWLTVTLLAPIPWAGRVWALPFLTAPAPSERCAREHGRRHKRLTDWGRQVLLLAARWLPERRVVAVADSSYAAIALLAAVRGRLTLVTRLRLAARLFEPAPPRRPGTLPLGAGAPAASIATGAPTPLAIGRPRVAGARLPTLAERLAAPTTRWRRVTVTGWYGRGERRLDVVSGIAVWYHPGLPAVPIRYVLARDVAGAFAPQAFLCTDPSADPLDILRWFVRRWSIEVTFAEVRRHLGVESQRQGSDPAIARTTSLLLGLFSLVTLWADELFTRDLVPPRRAAWYPKPALTFSAALAAVRHALWTAEAFPTSADHADVAKIPRAVLDRLHPGRLLPGLNGQSPAYSRDGARQRPPRDHLPATRRPPPPAVGAATGRWRRHRLGTARHGCYVVFQFAEVALPRALFAEILRRIDGLRGPPVSTT